MNYLFAPQQNDHSTVGGPHLAHAPEDSTSAFVRWLFGSNHFLVAGIVIMVTGYLLNTARQYAWAAWNRLLSELFLTVSIDSMDDAFQPLVEWIGKQESAKKARRLKVQSVRKRAADPFFAEETDGDENIRPTLLFVPSDGTHVFSFRGKWLWITRYRNQETGTFHGTAGFASRDETISITVFSRDTSVVRQLMDEAMGAFFMKDKGKTVIYVGYFNSWNRANAVEARPLSSVVLARDMKQMLLDDVLKFMGNQRWYKNRGIPYHRGYLLYGPPGTGKTSFISALAGKLGMSLSVVSLSNGTINDRMINTLMNRVRPKSIVLMEDVDVAFTDDDDRPKETPAEPGFQPNACGSVTFSGLLNAIDGVGAQDGRILFMTTNHIERLSPALIRPGRVDVRALFDYATPQQAAAMFRIMYYDCVDDGNATKGGETNSIHTPEALADMAQQFIEAIPQDRDVTTAQLQGFFMAHQDQPLAAIRNASKVGDADTIANPTTFI